MIAYVVATMLLACACDEGAPQRAAAGREARKPAGLPIAWEFELKFEDPKRIDVGGTTYWYVLYTATNTSDTTQRFFPQFEIVTDKLHVFHTDMGISPAVFDAIYQRHKGLYRYLVPPSQAIGNVKAGEDNAIESVAIWRDVDLDANAFSIFVTGLSGETRLAPNPVFDPSKPESVKRTIGGLEVEEVVNPRYFTLRKTLQIEYGLPGSPDARKSAAVERREARWIMR